MAAKAVIFGGCRLCTGNPPKGSYKGRDQGHVCLPEEEAREIMPAVRAVVCALSIFVLLCPVQGLIEGLYCGVENCYDGRLYRHRYIAWD